jgi:hypothetical protein
MKKLFAAAMLLMGSLAFAQTEKTISPMKEGTKLNADDIGFLQMVANVDVSKSRGSGEPSVTLNGATYKAGKTLTASDAASIGRAIKLFQANYNTPVENRSDLCVCWYYYCDYYGYCYWYKYYCAC